MISLEKLYKDVIIYLPVGRIILDKIYTLK